MTAFSTDEEVRAFVSHPVARGATLAVYVTGRDGGTALALVRDGVRAIVGAHVGPLGPTINARGDVAFRARDDEDQEAVFVAHAAGGTSCVARADALGCATFHGLPIVDDVGRVLVRADDARGPALFVAEHGGVRALELPPWVTQLGRFPAMSGGGMIAVAAARADGNACILSRSVDERDEWRVTFVPTGALSGVRGALVDDDGLVVAIATRADGALAVVEVDRAVARAGPIVAVGDAAFGSRVQDLALNPVSLRAPGTLAVRLVLDDGREIVARAIRG